jgi:hypothetical protein
LKVLDKMETISRRAPTIAHHVLARLQREPSPVELGAKSWRDVLKIRLRISGTDANRRLDEATDLGPRAALNGQPLQPKLDKVAEAQNQGRINADHGAVIRTFSPNSPAGSPHHRRTGRNHPGPNRDRVGSRRAAQGRHTPDM